MELIPFNPWEPFHVTEGNLPHWQQNKRTYFITWRTEDSIPIGWLRKLHHERAVWLNGHGISPTELGTLSAEKQREFHQRFTHAWHDKLDECLGECLLRNGDCRELVASALKHFDGIRYDLGNFVIMPNHVHLLVTLYEGQDLKKTCFSWKRFSSGKISKEPGRRGEFWQTESYDHIARCGETLRVIQNYIGNNPKKAKLRNGEFPLYQPETWK